MNILLINPSQSHVYGDLFSISQPPLGLVYIGTVIKEAGHYVKFLDLNSQQTSMKGIEDILRQNNIGLVGITTTTPTYNNALALAELVKKVSSAYVVLGGVHVSVLPEEPFTNPSVDFVVVGEGEKAITHLIDSLEGRTALSQTPGLVYRDKGAIIKNGGKGEITNLDDIPFPARELFAGQRYIFPDSLSVKVAPMITSRGCFGKCTFCLAPVLYQGRCRFRSAKNVVDEIEKLVRGENICEIHFWDDNFLGNRKRVFEIRDILKERKIKIKCAFPNGVRVDFISEEILNCLKDMGTYSISIGVESGSQDVLNLAKKQITLRKIEEVMTMIKRFGFESWGFFIFGLPGEDSQRMKQTIDFAIKTDPDIAKFHILKPFPGSEVYSYLKERNLILSYNYDDYGIHLKSTHRLEHLSQDQIIEFQKQAYRRFYLRPKKILRHIFRLRTLYRFKINILVALSLLKNTFRKEN